MKPCYFLVLLLVLTSSFAVADDQMGDVAGIKGTVYVDGGPSDDLSGLVTDIDTGGSATATTMSGGRYALGLTTFDGDTVRIDVRYNGITFSNTTKIDHDIPTQWLNLSIETDEPPNGPGNGQDPPPDDDEPDGNETEEPEQNETENGNETTYYLTVTVVDNANGNPIDHASVTVYCNESNISSPSYTNDTGVASFLLEEAVYTVEVMKDGYTGKSGSFTLLCSTEQSFSLEKTSGGSGNPNSTDGHGIPLYVYGIVCAIAVIIILGVIAYWRWYR